MTSAGLASGSPAMVIFHLGRCFRVQFLEDFLVPLRSANADRRRLSLLLSGEPQVSDDARSQRRRARGV